MIGETKLVPCIHCSEKLVEVPKFAANSRVECAECKKEKQEYFREHKEKTNYKKRKELVYKNKQLDYEVASFIATCQKSTISNMPKRSVRVIGK